MKRLFDVIKATAITFIVIDLFLTILLLIDFTINNHQMEWEYLGYVNLYGLIVSLIFGYMDNPILEKRLFIVIITGAFVLLVVSFFCGNVILSMQALYAIFGINLSRILIPIVDRLLKNKEN